MDSFEDLENPPTSIQNVVNNRWLNSSFKETVSGVYFPRRSSMMGNGQGWQVSEELHRGHPSTQEAEVGGSL